MYLDLNYEQHRRFAAYEIDYGAAETNRAGVAKTYDQVQQEIEQRYSLGKEQIAGNLKAASIQASASRANAKTVANAQIKVAGINAAANKYGVDVDAAVKREDIAAEMDRFRQQLALSREEMERIGIPEVRIKAWTAQKNYEIAKMGIGLQAAQIAAEYASTPDKYWIARDFENAVPALLGADMNGPTSTPEGAPKPNNLYDLLTTLGGGAQPGTSPTTTSPAASGTDDLYAEISKMTAGGGNYGAPAGTAGTMAADAGKQLSQAITAQGLSGVGGDINMDNPTQADFDKWIAAMRATGSGPDDPRLASIISAAKAAGFNVGAYDTWNKEATYNDPRGTGFGRAINPNEAATTAATGTTAPVGSIQALSPQDQGMLAGIAASMNTGGIDPFVFDKLAPDQQKIYLGGIARLGYDPNTEYWRAQTKRPGQDNPLLA